MGKVKARSNARYIILALVAVLIIVIVFQGSRIDYRVENGDIKINWLTGVTIPIKDIREISIIDKTPKMHRDMGISIFNIRQGTFTIENIGKVKMYSGNINRKLVIIRTDEAAYGVTPENPQEFVESVNEK